MAKFRLLIGAMGVLVMAFGAFALVQALSFDQLLGLAVWLGGALVLHDGVLVPLTIALNGLLTRAGRALPVGAILLIEGGFAVGAILTLVVVPELYAQSLGARNPTILAGDYGTRLLWVWSVLAVTVAAGVLILTVARRQRATG